MQLMKRSISEDDVVDAEKHINKLFLSAFEVFDSGM